MSGRYGIGSLGGFWRTYREDLRGGCFALLGIGPRSFRVGWIVGGLDTAFVKP